jgi:hypothetical protein
LTGAIRATRDVLVFVVCFLVFFLWVFVFDLVYGETLPIDECDEKTMAMDTAIDGSV